MAFSTATSSRPTCSCASTVRAQIAASSRNTSRKPTSRWPISVRMLLFYARRRRRQRNVVRARTPRQLLTQQCPPKPTVHASHGQQLSGYCRWLAPSVHMHGRRRVMHNDVAHFYLFSLFDIMFSSFPPRGHFSTACVRAGSFCLVQGCRG